MVQGSRTVLWVVVALVLSGCTGAPQGETPPDSDPIIHTSPGHFDATSDPTRFHLHDYWFGQDRLMLMEETRATGVGSLGISLILERFRPDAGNVVPLGTENVTVTLDWDLEPGAMYGEVWVYVKTQADAESLPFAVVENGVPVTFTSTNEQNDLPHQLLSSWSFDLFLTPDPQTNILRFIGDVSIEVVVERGLEIPLFPPHEDRWGDATEILLFDERDTVDHLDHYPAPNTACSSSGCFQVHVPKDGAIIAAGTDRVRVVLELDAGSIGDVRLAFHRADSRDWTEMDPTGMEGEAMVFEISADGAVDGPYATTSLWEFLVVTKKTEETALFSGGYRIHAVALKAT